MGSLLNNYKTEAIEEFIDGVQDERSTYYIFASHPFAWPIEETPPAVVDSMGSEYETYDNMLFGKRLKFQDIRFTALRYNWSPETVYTQYTDSGDIQDKNFYVITDENKVFKCLYNNKGGRSTQKPVLAQNTAFRTSDDYVWKYMFTVSNVDMTKFATSNTIPVVANTDVVQSAKNSIDVIEVTDPGTGYVAVHNGFIQQMANSSVIRIENDTSNDNGFYTNSGFYIKSGPGSGAVRKIVDYVSNTSGHWVYLNSGITEATPFQSEYLVSPYVNIKGNGQGAEAVCYVTANANIDKILVVNTGMDYTRASITIESNTFYGSGGKAVTYVAPVGGHGSDPARELYSDTFAINTQFNGSELDNIPTEVSFRRYGIIKDALNANTETKFANNTFNQLLVATPLPATVFTVGETVVGKDTGSAGRVVFSNSSVLMLSGSDKAFANLEIAVGQTSGANATLNIVSGGDLKPDSGQILHLNNVTTKPRSNSSVEVIKITIKV